MKKEKNTGFNKNLIFSFFLYFVSAAFLIASFSIEDEASRTFPQVICGLTILLSTLFLFSVLRGHYTNDDVNLTGTGMALFMAGIILLYILAITYVGYYIATVVFLPIGMLVLGQRNWIVIVSVDVGVTIFVYVFFGLLLSMQMPDGILF